VSDVPVFYLIGDIISQYMIVNILLSIMVLVFSCLYDKLYLK